MIIYSMHFRLKNSIEMTQKNVFPLEKTNHYNMRQPLLKAWVTNAWQILQQRNKGGSRSGHGPLKKILVPPPLKKNISKVDYKPVKRAKLSKKTKKKFTSVSMFWMLIFVSDFPWPLEKKLVPPLTFSLSLKISLFKAWQIMIPILLCGCYK